MEIIGKESGEVSRIQKLLDAYLVSREDLKSSAAETSFHLDEDSLAVFAEGRLTEREATPVVSHLVACGFCRHKTAELIRLELEFAEADLQTAPLAESEPAKISEVLSGLLAKIFGTSDSAVFAHNEKENEDENAKEEKADTEK
jgi:hypothetical protein